MLVNNKQVFIVDDDESVCRSLKYLLGTYEFRVKAFTSAEDFFSAVPNSSPGCLVMDVHMPGLNGWEAQQRLSRSGSKRPVIIISEDKEGGRIHKELALQSGAVGFLQKPFDDQELVDLINQALTN